MNKKKNLFSALLFQAMHIIYGLIVPRLILGGFGSEINGLVSSITQFLSFITLLEGGLGAVVLAELYRPIEKKDTERIKGILYSCQTFFSKLTFFFVIYTIVLAAVYSYFVRNKFDIGFTISLVFILSLTTVAQYLFSITLKLYLQADQKIYISNIITSITYIVNTVIAFLVIRFFPEIRLLKLLSSIAFFVQPFIYSRYVNKEYIDYRHNKKIGVTLKNRWSGFAQNLAHYVNMNTDVVLITLFCTLSDVSIYTVYLYVINAIRSIVSSVTNSYQSALGKYLAQNDGEKLNRNFKKFCIYTWAMSLVLFCTCLIVVNPFVYLYTNNVNDANYYQPVFALIIITANLIYCIREPYRLIILAAGKFKETNFGSMMEAFLNFGISIILVKPFGLIGVAIGTLVAILYRFLYFIVYLNKEMVKFKLNDYWRYIIIGALIIVCNYLVYFNIKIHEITLLGFLILGTTVFLVEGLIIAFAFLGMEELKEMVHRIVP